ncbi:hypothetical protein L596_007021 [Steinernema carpocapsae]|uniref:Cyclin N-terminal domain-containing protein n=1 Tax=Steinernema carpocapsae TaxID=34508 RepID=A0A4U5P7W6_STECR|nr:hypothetical protein L596_007021 [Steinernema carpocapsae]
MDLQIPTEGTTTSEYEGNDMDADFGIGEVSSEQELGEWFSLMLEHNTQQMANPQLPSYDLGERFTRQLFEMCNKIRLSTEVKINSAIVLNKYLNTLKTKASNLLLNESNVHTRRQLHEQVRNRMLRHMPIRMISSIQIASKMFTYRYTPTLKEIRKYLDSIDQPFLPEDIVASEMTVLESVNFDVTNSHSPIAYLETVLQLFVLGRPEKTNFNVQKYWKACMEVIELVFLSYDDAMKYIIKSYLHINKEAHRNLGRPSMQHLKCDYLLLACGVLCVPVSRLAGKLHLHVMAKQLSNLTSLEFDHIIASANGIVHMIRKTQKLADINHETALRLDRTIWSLLDEESAERKAKRKRKASMD